MVSGGVVWSLLGLLGQVADVPPTNATPIRIELDAPPDCATAEGFFESVRARTERARPVREGETGVRVLVHLTRVGGRVHGELRVIGEHGESDARRLDGATCTEVVDALSLTVALAVDPTARLGPPKSAAAAAPAPSASASAAVSTPRPPLASTAEPSQVKRSPEPSEPTEPMEPAEPSEVPEQAEPPEEPAIHGSPRPEIRVGVHLLGLGHVAPFVSFGGDLFARVVAPWPSASSLGVSVLHARNDLVARAERASVRTTLISLTLCPKRLGSPRVFTFDLCGLGTGGSLGGSGRGVQRSSSVIRSYFAAGGELIGTLPLGSGFGLELQAGFLVPFVRRRFVLQNPDHQVAETPSVAGLGAIGAAYSF